MYGYLPKSFQRDAKRIGVTDEDCREAIRRAENGLIDATLGGGLIKQRIATGNRGAAKGARAVVFYKRGKLAVFPAHLLEEPQSQPDQVRVDRVSETGPIPRSD